MRVLKTLAAILCTFLVLCAILAYIAGLSMRQSIVLALLITSLLREIEKVGGWRKPFSRFSPYYVAVSPKWSEILIDFKMIEGRDELEAVIKSSKDRSVREYQVLLDGIFFTVVHESRDLKRTLIYMNRHRSFRSKVEIHEEMTPLSVKHRDNLSLRSHWVPEFFMVRRWDGYELGIRVPDSWWNAMKSSCPAPTKVEVDHPCGRVDLTLGVVPWKEFDFYWEPAHSENALYEKVKSLRDGQRSMFGWTDITRPRDSELAISWPDTIDHKYFVVSHDEI